MSSYSLDISGSWFILVLSVLAGLALAYWSYRRTVPPIPKSKKVFLVTLRTIALAILLFVLFEPVITIISGSEEPPRVAVLFDNSVSAGTDDARGNRSETYMKALENADLGSMDDDESFFFRFAAEPEPLEEYSPDSVDFAGQLTDISAAVRKVTLEADEENIRAVVLVTDGAFNSGNNPVYDAEQLARPVYAIGIGDSTEPKDIAIQSILTNEIAYIDNSVPVNIDVKIHGYEEGEFKITLTDNGKLVSEQKFMIHPEKNIYPAVFEYLPKTEGIHKLVAKVSSLEDEITRKNNIASEFVTVLKNKRNIAVFSGAPSPDLSFIKKELSREKGLEITSYVQKKGSQFYGDAPTEAALNESQIIFLIGFPISSTPVSVIDMIKKQAERGKSIFFVASKNTDYKKLKRLERYLPFNSISSNNKEFLALADVTPSSLSSPLLRITGTEQDMNLWNNLPPVFMTESFVRVKPESNIEAGVKVNNVQLKEPMILSRSFQNQKSVAVMAYGLYRWKLLGYASDIAKGRTETPDIFSEFLSNSLRWLSVTDKRKTVTVKTGKKHYSIDEKIGISAQVYDAAYTPIDNASVSIELRGNQQRSLILNSIGNGRYTGTVEGLPEGDYAFEGLVRLNDRNYGSDRGRFSVGEIAIEYQNLQMNAPLLRDLAARTGGRFYTPETAGSLLEDIRSHKGFTSRSITTRAESALWNIPWLLALAILCFAAEWFIRKRAGMI